MICLVHVSATIVVFNTRGRYRHTEMHIELNVPMRLFYHHIQVYLFARSRK
mgnify:CR=1 FL=1|jgi:hypothetical protein